MNETLPQRHYIANDEMEWALWDDMQTINNNVETYQLIETSQIARHGSVKGCKVRWNEIFHGQDVLQFFWGLSEYWK